MTGRCGVCSEPALVGVICPAHWDRLLVLLGEVAELVPVSSLGPVVPSAPRSLATMHARRALTAALGDAQRALRTRVLASDSVASVAVLRSRLDDLQVSWVAPVLVRQLEVAVAELGRAVDPAPARLRVPARCPRCGPASLVPVGGLLECEGCGRRWSLRELRRVV